MLQAYLRLFVFLFISIMFQYPNTSADELPRAVPENVGLSSAKLDKINQIVTQAIKDNKTAGAVVVVLWQGCIVHFSAHGWQDIDGRLPMRLDTVFRLYSMTKPITTVAAMLLADEGRFKLDDPVSKYLPELKHLRVFARGEDEEYEACQNEMTVRDLMCHSSGLTYGGGNTPVDRICKEKNFTDLGRTLEQFIEELGEVPLKYQPGTRFEYGLSTDVLGRLVEVWSGQELDEFLADRIFAPLQMKDTGFSVPDASIKRFAAMYGPDPDGGLKEIDSPETSPFRVRPKMLSGGGGLVSTAGDYVRFCQMLLNGGLLDNHRILKRESVALMTQNHIPKDALPIVHGHPKIGWGFGLGFSIRMKKDVDDPLPIGECRWEGAASTSFSIWPKDEIAVVVMQQHRPFIEILENTIKPIVFEAITN